MQLLDAAIERSQSVSKFGKFFTQLLQLLAFSFVKKPKVDGLVQIFKGVFGYFQLGFQVDIFCARFCNNLDESIQNILEGLLVEILIVTDEVFTEKTQHLFWVTLLQALDYPHFHLFEIRRQMLQIAFDQSCDSRVRSRFQVLAPYLRGDLFFRLST